MTFHGALSVAKEYGGLILFLGIIGFLAYLIQGGLTQNNAAAISEAVDLEASVQPEFKNYPQRDWTVPEAQINAASVLSLESNLLDYERVLLSENKDRQVPIASLTKLMTAMVVLDNYDLAESVTVGSLADKQDPVIRDVALGGRYSVSDLLHIMLMSSSNKAAYAFSVKMGEKSFIAAMNQKAERIGLKNTKFFEPTGLSDKNYSSAEDLAKLTLHILKNYPTIVNITSTKRIDLAGFGTIENTNELLGEIPNIIIGKTGYTQVAKQCLILVTHNQKTNDYLVYVILGAEDRFLEMRKLIDWVQTAYTW